jgi:hypothetical protein
MYLVKMKVSGNVLERGCRSKAVARKVIQRMVAVAAAYDYCEEDFEIEEYRSTTAKANRHGRSDWAWR